MPLSINGKISYLSSLNSIKTTITAKWVAPHRPQEFDPISGLFITSENKISGHSLINITASKKIFNNYNIRSHPTLAAVSRGIRQILQRVVPLSINHVQAHSNHPYSEFADRICSHVLDSESYSQGFLRIT